MRVEVRRIIALVVVAFVAQAEDARAQPADAAACESDEQLALARHSLCRIKANVFYKNHPNAEAKRKEAFRNCEDQLREARVQLGEDHPNACRFLGADEGAKVFIDLLDLAVDATVEPAGADAGETEVYECFVGGLCGRDGAGMGARAEESLASSVCKADDRRKELWLVGLQVYNLAPPRWHPIQRSRYLREACRAGTGSTLTSAGRPVPDLKPQAPPTRFRSPESVLQGILKFDNAPPDLVERWKLRPYSPLWRDLQQKWLGIRTAQHPFDVWITQEIIQDVKPDFIIETGTNRGGSAGLWAMILEQVNPDGKVITVDIQDQATDAKKLPVVKRRVEFLIGSSTDPKIVAKIAKRVEGKKVLVILDSLHEKGHVLKEMEAYAPLVSAGSYVIVQDTHLGDTVPFWFYQRDAWWTPGPLAAVNEFVGANGDFIIDTSREVFPSSNNKNGWVKRVN